MVDRRMYFRRLGHFLAGVLGVFYFGVDTWRIQHGPVDGGCHFGVSALKTY